jgi:hypothetical protein
MIIPTPGISNSPGPNISRPYNAIQRARQAAIDLTIQTNTAIVTTIYGKIVRRPAAELIKQHQLTS